MFENDYAIYGKHATFLKFLAMKNSNLKEQADNSIPSAGLFERYVDVYMNAAIWGLLYERTAPKDNTSDDRARIYADAFSAERDNCVFIYRMVMLLDKKTHLDPQTRIDRAFRYDVQDDKKEEFAKNMDLFNAYVRGGIEEMYEQFTNGCTTREDYMNKIYDIITTFQKELEGISYEEELNKLIG